MPCVQVTCTQQCTAAQGPVAGAEVAWCPLLGLTVRQLLPTKKQHYTDTSQVGGSACCVCRPQSYLARTAEIRQLLDASTQTTEP